MVKGGEVPAGLDQQTKALVALAVAVAQGEEPAIRERVTALFEAGTPPVWVDELLLQSVLMAGWPRALVAAAIWRRVSPEVEVGEAIEGGYKSHRDWTKRGEETCKQVYGDNYPKLRANQHQLHPSLDEWMITEGYGRTLSRPGLDLVRRELCVVAQTAALGTHRQLHSHLRGALNCGATPEMVEATLSVVNGFVSYDDWKSIKELWDQVESGWSSAS